MYLTAMLTHYESLCRASGGVALGVRPGLRYLKTPTAERFLEIIRYCLKHDMDPIAFLEAQFSEWKDKSRFPSTYPTPKHLGLTPNCMARYVRSQKRLANPSTRVRSDEETAASSTMNMLLSVRKDLKSEEDVLSDPLLVRLFPPNAVKNHPVFKRLASAGVYDSCREMLTGYL